MIKRTKKNLDKQKQNSLLTKTKKKLWLIKRKIHEIQRRNNTSKSRGGKIMSNNRTAYIITNSNRINIENM